MPWHSFPYANIAVQTISETLPEHIEKPINFDVTPLRSTKLTFLLLSASVSSHYDQCRLNRYGVEPTVSPCLLVDLYL